MTSRFLMPDVYTDNFIIVFKTNNNPQDNHYTIKDQWGNVVVNKSAFNAATTYYDTLKLSKGCYTFEFVDDGLDGLDYWAYPEQGKGTLRFRKLTGLTLKTFNPDMGHGIKYSFAIQNVVALVEKENMVKSFEVYPNPGSGKLNLDITGLSGENKIDVFNLTGMLVFSESRIMKDFENINLDLSQLQKGLYLIRISSGNTSLIKKIVIN
jgi:hypothetical protein